jgi:hypothetical protein
MESVPNSQPAGAGQHTPPSSAALCDGLRYELIGEAMDLAASYARSAGEAAWRGDRATLQLHIKQTRLTLLTAIETFKLLGEAAQDGRAA